MAELNYSRAGDGQPLVVMHGLFGSARNWQSLARRFADRFDVVNLDLRNHGQSFHDEVMDYPAMAADVIALIEKLELGPCHLLGHSMGGKVAMTVAAVASPLLGRIVVADIAPVAYSHDYDELIDPILALDLDGVSSRAEVDSLLGADIADDPLRAFLLHNLHRDATGWRWRVNWDAIKRNMPAITGFDHLPADWRVDLPSLFIRGGASDYVGDAEIDVIHSRFAAAELATIDAAGHWLHAEKPEPFAAAVLDFLDPT